MISTTASRNDYTGNNSASVYAYTFRIFVNADLTVSVKNVATGVETTLVINTDYTVSGANASAGGNVTLVNAAQAWLDGSGHLATGYTMTIRRVRPLTQTTDIRNQGTFFPETHEDAFDNGIMVAQQHQDQIDRSVKLPVSVLVSSFDPTLPTDIVTNGANKVPALNGTGSGFAAASTWPTISQITSAAASAAAAAASAAASAVSAAAALVSQLAAAASAVAAAASAASAAASQPIDIGSGTFAARPAAPTRAQIYYDSTNDAVYLWVVAANRWLTIG